MPTICYPPAIIAPKGLALTRNLLERALPTMALANHIKKQTLTQPRQTTKFVGPQACQPGNLLPRLGIAMPKFANVLGNFAIKMANFHIVLAHFPIVLSNVPILMGRTPILMGRSPILMGNIPILMGNSPNVMGNIPMTMAKPPTRGLNTPKCPPLAGYSKCSFYFNQ